MGVSTSLTFEQFEKYSHNGHSETLATELHSALFPGWSAPVAAIFPD